MPYLFRWRRDRLALLLWLCLFLLAVTVSVLSLTAAYRHVRQHPDPAGESASQELSSLSLRGLDTIREWAGGDERRTTPAAPVRLAASSAIARDSALAGLSARVSPQHAAHLSGSRRSA
jgi:hypothetical protein